MWLEASRRVQTEPDRGGEWGRTTKGHEQRTQRAKRAKERGKSKSVGLCRNKKQGKGKGSPGWRGLGWGRGKKSREEPQVLSASRGQCGLWYANKHHSYPFVLSFFGRSHIKTKQNPKPVGTHL